MTVKKSFKRIGRKAFPKYGSRRLLIAEKF